jgi:hypothetical protein
MELHGAQRACRSKRGDRSALRDWRVNTSLRDGLRSRRGATATRDLPEDASRAGGRLEQPPTHNLGKTSGRLTAYLSDREGAEPVVSEGR